jgi:hypothetical protein
MQELKSAQQDIKHSRQQLRRFIHIVIDHVRGPLQRRPLRTSVAAAHEALKAQRAMEMAISAKSATAAFTSLRLQTNAHTDAVVRNVFSIVTLSARQAADSQRKARMDVAMARAAVEICMQHMHVHSRCQQTFRDNAAAHVRAQQAAALQSFITEQCRGMRAMHTVRGCWRSVLQRTMHKAAADACILSSQSNARMHKACARALSNKCAAAVAINSSHAAKARLGCIQAVRESKQWHNSVAATFAQLVGSAQQAELRAHAVLVAKNPPTAGSVHSERAGHTRARFSSATSAKQMAKQLVNINARSGKKRMSDFRPATTEVVAARRFTTHSPAPRRPRSASSKLQQSESIRPSAGEKDIAQGRFGSASGTFSRILQASSSQRLFAQQALQMQEMQELDVVAEELSERLHTLPDLLRSRANSHEHG